MNWRIFHRFSMNFLTLKFDVFSKDFLTKNFLGISAPRMRYSGQELRTSVRDLTVCEDGIYGCYLKTIISKQCSVNFQLKKSSKGSLSLTFTKASCVLCCFSFSLSNWHNLTFSEHNLKLQRAVKYSAIKFEVPHRRHDIGNDIIHISHT